MSAPVKTSIALCTWNGEAFLGAQLDSILAQTRLPDELVICDDNSSDSTLELARQHVAQAPFSVRILANNTNVGSTRNFQRAFEACSGDIVFPCDHDDIWHQEKLAHCVSAMDASRSDWLFHDADLIDAESNPLPGSHWSKLELSQRQIQAFRNSSQQFQLLLKRPYVTGCCMAIRRTALQACIPFGSRWIHDEWMAAILTAKGFRGLMLPDRLTRYRQHPMQQVGLRATGWKGRLHRICAADQAAYQAEAAKNHELETALIWSQAHTFAIACVRAKREHYLFRALESSATRLELLRKLWNELTSGRYARYSWGVLAPLKDLTRILLR